MKLLVIGMSAKSHLFTRPDINLDMSLLDYINPFNKVMDSADNLVDRIVLDKDAALQIRSELAKARISAQQQIETSYQIALQTKTHPAIDGLHKMARPIMGMVTLYTNHSTVSGWMESDVTMTSVHIGILALQWGPTGLYTAMKGRGKP